MGNAAIPHPSAQAEKNMEDTLYTHPYSLVFFDDDEEDEDDDYDDYDDIDYDD